MRVTSNLDDMEFKRHRMHAIQNTRITPTCEPDMNTNAIAPGVQKRTVKKGCTTQGRSKTCLAGAMFTM